MSRCQGKDVCNGRDDEPGPCAVIKYYAVMQEKTGTLVTVPVNQAGGNNNVLMSLSMSVQAIVTQQGRHCRGLYKQRKQDNTKGNGLDGPPVVK